MAEMRGIRRRFMLRNMFETTRDAIQMQRNQPLTNDEGNKLIEMSTLLLWRVREELSIDKAINDHRASLDKLMFENLPGPRPQAHDQSSTSGTQPTQDQTPWTIPPAWTLSPSTVRPAMPGLPRVFGHIVPNFKKPAPAARTPKP
jgi:hypothetical protein